VEEWGGRGFKGPVGRWLVSTGLAKPCASVLFVVLVIVGVELMIFIVNCMGLCFRFVMESLLNSACTVPSASHAAPTANRLGLHKKMERTPLGFCGCLLP